METTKRVVEPSGDRSRTLYCIEAPPAPVRVKEKVLALVALFLLVAYLDGGNIGAQIVQERKEKIEAQYRKLAVERTSVLVACLNGHTLETEEVRVQCRVKQLRASQ